MGAACTKDTGVIVGGKPVVPVDDDVWLRIFSFVSYAPFENDSSGTMTLSTMRRGQSSSDIETNRLVRDYNDCSFKLSKALRIDEISRVSSPRAFGTLTHVLPLINKRFHRLCKKSNALWSESLERLVGFRSTHLRSCDLWKRGLISYTMTNEGNDATEERTETSNVADDDESVRRELERARELITKAIELDACGPREQSCKCVCPKDYSAREVFRQALLHHKQVRLPVYTKCFDASIGQEVTLRFVEPRHLLLITEIMADKSYLEKRGFPLNTPRPRFLLACKPIAWREKVACIVEVRRCNLHNKGALADVTVVPISWVLMQDLSPRPDSGGLVDATVVRSPKRTRLPVFCMQGRLTLGQSIHLRHVKEPYKLLIAELMADRPESQRRGSFITQPRPQFVCQTSLKPGNVACVVEVERCWTYCNGAVCTCVDVVPSFWVLVETLSQRPQSDGLFDAQVVHLTRRHTPMLNT